jgi:NAD(P)-dependent dehydrogenase (short-subunit alcohol dehydrogenase family)
MSGRLSGKVCVVTGTGGSMGHATALTFAREGALLVGCDGTVDPADEPQEAVRAAGGQKVSRRPVWRRCSRVASAIPPNARSSSSWR